MSLRRKIFYGFTLAVVALLLILPSTSWLAWQQLSPSLHGAPNLAILFDDDKTSIAALQKRLHETADRSPNDFELQFAYATSAFVTDEQILRLEALNKKFPHNPVLISSLLRLMTSSQIRIYRYAELDVLYARKSSLSTEKYEPSDPAYIARFLTLAQEGELLEPKNAYFPMMATIGYFTAHKDAEAVAAWERASKKSDWDDHVTAVTVGHWKLYQMANGGRETGSLARAFTQSAVIDPHMGSMRNATRLVLVKAVQAELAGNKEAGIRLRRATRVNGELMLLHSKSLFKGLTGNGIAMMSNLRPGGAAALKKPYKDKKTTDAWVIQQQDQYKSYLIENGHADEAEAFAHVVSQGTALRTLWTDAQDKIYYGFGRKTYQLLGASVADALLLTGVLFALTFAAIFKLVYRFSPRLQKSEPLQGSARWGVSLGFVIPIIVGIVRLGTGTDWAGASVFFWSGCGIAGLLFILPPVLMRLSGQQIGHGLLVMLATIAALAGLIAPAWVAQHMLAYLFQSISLLGGLMAEDIGSDPGNAYLFPFLATSLVIFVPVLMLATFGILSRILRVSFAAGVTRGMRSTAVPLAATLVLIWAGVFLYTLQQDNRATAELQHMATIGEGQTFAEILGRPYP